MEKVWGGNRISALNKDKRAEPGKIIGESWELVDRPEAQSVAAGGAWDGMTLRQMLEQDCTAILGAELAAAKPARFPLLAKYVDAGSALSVQVHPDDEGAKPFNDRGKSECWIVVHAEPGSTIIRGLKPHTRRETYEKAVAGGTVDSVLHHFHPKTGDVIAMPPGTVHAIGAGILVAEIQQNSDLTLRIYDYNRKGLDGKPRPLHVKEALAAIRFDHPGDEFTGDMRADTVAPLMKSSARGVTTEIMFKGRYFDLQRFTIEPGRKVDMLAMPGAPRVVMVVSGSGTIGGRPFPNGQTMLIPASTKNFEVCANTDGRSLILLVSAPTKAAC
jgi:mannose-6-phosphate isomerase class I